MTRRTFATANRRTITITALYAAVAALWIYSSDALLELLIPDPSLFALASTYKGWAFVVVTSALLFAVLRSSPAPLPADEDRPDATPLRIWPPLLIFVLFVAAVGSVGLLVYRSTARAARVKAEETLAAIADLKTQQVTAWLAERRGNAERASNSPFTAPETEAWLARGAPEDETAERLRRRLTGLRTSQRWGSVYLVDPEGRVRMDVRDRPVESPASRTLALEAMRLRRVLMRDVHRDVSGNLAVSFFAPLMVKDAAGERAVAGIVMELDPGVHLFPLVASWPLPAQSGESILVRREGDSAVYLSELRHLPGAALTVRRPLRSKKFVAAPALEGVRLPIEGLDYRGTRVLACARKIPGTDWVLISKIDMSEINGPVIGSARLVALFGFVLVAAAGLATAFWLRQERSNALVRHYRNERERTMLTRKLDHLTRYANDMILLIDNDGRILDVNERAVAGYGRSREELIGTDVATFRPPGAQESFAADWARAGQQDGIVYETVQQRGDGTTFEVEVSSRAIELDGTIVRQSIVRDISERKEAERKIRRLSNIYAALTHINQTIVRGTPREALFEQLCHAAVDFGQLDFAWVALVDAERGIVVPAACHGPDAAYLDGIEFSLDPALPSGRGPIATTIREVRTYVCSDIDTDPNTLPWRGRAAQHGFRALATFPLACEGTAIGALAVYAKQAGFFDPETIALLEEMTHDVSFALDSIAGDARRAAAEEALRESEEKYRLLFSNEQDAIVVFDAETARIVEANEAFLALSGYSHEEARELTVDQVSAEPQATIGSIATVREAGSERVKARRFRRRDGSVIWVEIGLNSFVWRGRRLVSAIVRDITDRKDAEERALLWSNVLENSAEAIVITDADQHIVHVNKAFTEVTGFTPEEVLGQAPRILASARYDDDFFRTMMRTIRETGRWQGEMSNRRRNGDIYPGWLSITAVRDASGTLTHFIGIFSDITERKKSAERINFLANHDPLTGLPNRSVMNDLIQQSVAIARRKSAVLAVLSLDLDRFKTINDSLGHPVGDALLRQVAERLGTAVREEDIIARIGGDEFLILLPELARGRDAAVVAEKILAALRDPLTVDGHVLRITASIGISIYPEDGGDVATLIKNADAAMYHAKELGRNVCQFFTSDMNARALEALAMEMSLRGAVQREEFTLHYQPQVDAVTGRIVAAEALIRWHHPELGRISPAGFIPIAEEHGLIVPIGEWVLRTACLQLRTWLDAGLNVVPVAVNMSAVQFRQPGLPARVREILAEFGVEPRYLELELTESIIMRDAEQAIAVLEELSQMGVSLAIDDFGTGYSSLSYLRRFPIDRLKIDQSFVRDITVNPDAAAIAAAIIGMGRNMKLRVVAEGVETAEQMEFLTAERCDELQGFHIARPMEAGAFSLLLGADRPLAGFGSASSDKRTPRLA